MKTKSVSRNEDDSWRPDSLETMDSDGDTEDEVERCVSVFV